MEEYGGVQVSLPLGFGWNGECERIGADSGGGCICVVGADIWACVTSYKPRGVDVAPDGTKQPSNPAREVSYPVSGLGGASSDGFRVQGGNLDSVISSRG